MTPQESKEKESLRLLGDDPITKASDDRLDRVEFARRMIELIHNVADETPSSVFGLIGPWGSGKSSVLRLVENDVSQDKSPWKVVAFNPWELSSLEAVVHEFLLTIASALPDVRGEVRRKLGNYMLKVAPFAGALRLPGLDLEKALEVSATSIVGDSSLAALRHDLEADLRTANQPILLLVDDIDRLQADELAVVLKLVRLVGRLPNVHYVLAYDEQTVLDVLERTDVAAGDARRALSYLDKIVQVRLDLPPVHPTRIGALFDTALDSLVTSHDIELTSADQERLALAYHRHLTMWLSEPRNVKRFFGQVAAFYPLVRGEVDFIDFLLTTFVRIAHPQLHTVLRHHKEELTGIAMEPRTVTPDERRKTWERRLAHAGVAARDIDGLLALLAELFIPIESATQNFSSGAWAYAERAEAQRVGSSEYFDRYFYLAVPPDDVKDSEIRSVLDGLLRGEDKEQFDQLRARLEVAAEAVFDKLIRFSPRDAASARILLPFTAELALEAPEVGILGRARMVAERWFAEQLRIADLEEPEQLLSELLLKTPLQQIAAAVRLATRLDEADDRQPTTAQIQFREVVVAELERSLDSQATRPVGDSDNILALFYLWRDLAGPAAVRSWLRQQAVTPPWSLEAVVAIFVGITRYIGSDRREIGGLDTAFLDDVLGIDFVLENMTPRADDAADLSDLHDVSFDARRRRAHSHLARLARERKSGSKANSEGSSE